MAKNFTSVHRNANNPNPSLNQDNNSEYYSDEVFAQLTDMFGETYSCEIISKAGKKFNWDLTKCIDNLIQFAEVPPPRPPNSPVNNRPFSSLYSDQQIETTMSDHLHNLRIAYKHSEHEDISDDVDVVIESEQVDGLLDKSRVAEENIIPQFPSVNSGAIRKHQQQPPLNSTHEQPTTSSAFQQPFVNFSSLLKNSNFTFPTQEEPPKLQITHKSKTKMHDGKSANYDQIVQMVNRGIKVMVLMRGAPGSGKSFLAKKLVDETVKGPYPNHIFSSDDFFYDINDVYRYTPSRLDEAHDFNQRRVVKRASEGWSPIIVDNTNTKIWELYAYVKIAVDYGYLIEIVEPTTVWAHSARQLAQRNSHDVPQFRIERMLKEFEKVTVPQLLRLRGWDRHLELAPQIRKFPFLSPGAASMENTYAMNPELSVISDKVPMLEREWRDDWLDQDKNQTDKQAPSQSGTIPKPPRQTQRNSMAKRGHKTSDLESLDWKIHDQETVEFWNRTNDETKQKEFPYFETTLGGESKPQRPIQNTPTKATATATASAPRPDENLLDFNPGNSKLEIHKIDCPNENPSFAQIREIYPTVSLECLWDLFEKCSGNVDWTMDLLLGDDANTPQYDLQNKKYNRLFQCQCDNPIEYATEVTPSSPTNLATAAAALQQQIPPLIPMSSPSNSVARKNNRKNRNGGLVAEETQNTKRKIEETITIGNEHYSDHMKKIRDIRRGVNMPQLTGSDNLIDLMNPADATDNDTESSEADNDEIVEVSLGQELVSQLDNMFGIEAYSQAGMSSIKTNVFMPKSLAQQLYALWMESAYNQIEEQRHQSIKQDEEIARTLHSQEKYPNLYKTPTNLKEIMDMERTWAQYKADVDSWKKTMPQTMASQLTNDKLQESFPNIKMDVLTEMLAAHDYKYDETVLTLRDSLKEEVDDQQRAEDLFEKARKESEANQNNSFEAAVIGSDAMGSLEPQAKLSPDQAKKAALEQFEECRNNAMHHSQLKGDCYAKAQNAIQRGETSVALYFSQVASLHKNKVDMYNHIAANCIMEVHNYTQNNPDIVDLHYLRVSEAVEWLDIFIDKHINKLKAATIPYKHVHVITGRGLHSAGGIASIKQKVKSRLRDRKLRSHEVNPGLLRVKILSTSRLSQM